MHSTAAAIGVHGFWSWTADRLSCVRLQSWWRGGVGDELGEVIAQRGQGARGGVGALTQQGVQGLRPPDDRYGAVSGVGGMQDWGEVFADRFQLTSGQVGSGEVEAGTGEGLNPGPGWAVNSSCTRGART